jgi:hypothetical protein
VAVAVGVAVADAETEGALSTEHFTSLIRQFTGSPAVVEDEATKPTLTDLPGAMSLSQLSALTVMCRPEAVYVPFHRELSVVPDGRSNRSVQPDSAVAVLLVISYWPVYPVVQSLALVYAAPTDAACAAPARAKPPPATTAPATRPAMSRVLLPVPR